MSEADILCQIKELIDQDTGNKSKDQVTELTLDMVALRKISPELQKFLEEYENVASISLNGCKLRSLDNFPNFPHLTRLELIENQLTGKSISCLKKYSTLQSISLGKNTIKSIDDILALKSLPQILQLDLTECAITEIPNYREKVFEAFPTLLILDNKNKEGQEVQYSDTDDNEDAEYDDLDKSDDDDENDQGGDDDEDDEEDDDEDQDVGTKKQKH